MAFCSANLIKLTYSWSSIIDMYMAILSSKHKQDKSCRLKGFVYIARELLSFGSVTVIDGQWQSGVWYYVHEGSSLMARITCENSRLTNAAGGLKRVSD